MSRDAVIRNNKKRTKANETYPELRRSIIAPMFRRGCTYKEMREEVMTRLDLKTYSLYTVKNDVDHLLHEWRQERIENTDLALQLELNRIDDIIKEAWDAWEKSKADYEKKRARQEGVPGEEGVTAEASGGVVVVKLSQEREDVRSCGDPRYLDTIDKQLKERRKLLGLYAPEKKLVATDLSFANFLMKTGTKKTNHEQD